MRQIGLVALAAIALALGSCAKDEHGHEHAGHTTDAATTATAAAPATGTGANARTAEPPVQIADEPVKFGEASGYLALPPAGPPKKAALIVIQEWWGVDDWIRQQNSRFAQKGYVSLAVDLYRGRVASSPDEAHELMRGMPEDRAMADLKAAVDYLSSRPDVDPKRIGVIGWCMGGGYALALATSDERIKATVINYGRLVTDANAITKVQGPVMGNFGGKDRGIPVADVNKFGGDLTRYGKAGDIKVYDNAGHAFMNPNNKEGYDEAAALDAWARIDGFLDRTLRANLSNS